MYYQACLFLSMEIWCYLAIAEDALLKGEDAFLHHRAANPSLSDEMLSSTKPPSVTILLQVPPQYPHFPQWNFVVSSTEVLIPNLQAGMYPPNFTPCIAHLLFKAFYSISNGLSLCVWFGFGLVWFPDINNLNSIAKHAGICWLKAATNYIGHYQLRLSCSV